MRTLEMRDLISIGIFAAVYIVGIMIFSTLTEFNAVTFFFWPAITALLLAPVYLLFLARTQARFALSILGVINGFVFFMMMPKDLFTITVPLLSVALAELFFQLGKGKRFLFDMFSYVCFSLWPFGIFISFWVHFDKWAKMAEGYGHGNDFIASRTALIRVDVYIAMFGATLVMAIIGSFIAKAMLKKHFKKAGIV